jgi:hypothetical protein
VESLDAMREFAVQSGTLMAQFALYNPYPGTVDYYEMVQDQRKRESPGYRPKHRTALLLDRFWLTDAGPAEVIAHANLTGVDLLRENRLSWDRFYSLSEILRRTQSGIPERWGVIAKATYVMISLIFRRVYAGNGLVADVVHRRKLGRVTKAGITVAMFCYRWCAGGGVRVRMRAT